MEEAFVSFELAKLLKEKGFNESSFAYYSEFDDWKILRFWRKYARNPINTFYLCAPTHQMAMRWLREIYDLHIIACPFKSGNDTSTKHYCCQVFKTFNLLGHEKYTNETLTSYEEAVETAIKYCLEKLIK